MEWTRGLFVVLGVAIALLIVYWRTVTGTVKTIVENKDNTPDWEEDPKTCQKANGGKHGICAHYTIDRSGKRVVIAVTAHTQEAPQFVEFLVKYNTRQLQYLSYLGRIGNYQINRMVYEPNTPLENEQILRFTGSSVNAGNTNTDDVQLVTIVFKLLDQNVIQSDLEAALSITSSNYDIPDNPIVLRTPMDDPRVQADIPIACEGVWVCEGDDVQRYEVLNGNLNGGAECRDESNEIIQHNDTRNMSCL